MQLLHWFVAVYFGLFSVSFAFDACNEEDRETYQPAAERASLGVYYAIHRCGVETSYLLGTIHADDARIKQRVQPAHTQLRQAGRVWFEFVTTPQADQYAAQMMLLPEGESLQDYVPEKEFKELAALFRESQGIPTSMLQRFKPWAAAALLNYPAAVDDGVVLDDALQQYAKAVGRDIAGVETIEEQLTLFDGMSDSLQRDFLLETLQHYPQLMQSNQQLIEAYLSNDLREMVKVVNGYTAVSESPRLNEFVQENVLKKRNQLMVKRLLRPLQKGNQFVAVGALHLPDATGLLTQLEKSGYYLIAMSLSH